MHDPDPTKWLPHRDVTEQYCLEMASEHLVVDPKTKKRYWKETGNVRNEAWDLEVLQRLAAEMDNIAAAPAPTPDKPQSHRDAGMEYTNPFARR